MANSQLSEELNRLLYSLRPKPGESDLSLGEHMIMTAIRQSRHEFPEGITPSVLAERLGLSRPAITPQLNGLERKGRILREADPKDRRRILVRPSQDCGQFREGRLAKIEARLSVLNPQEQETLLALLRKLNPADAGRES